MSTPARTPAVHVVHPPRVGPAARVGARLEHRPGHAAAERPFERAAPAGPARSGVGPAGEREATRGVRQQQRDRTGQQPLERAARVRWPSSGSAASASSSPKNITAAGRSGAPALERVQPLARPPLDRARWPGRRRCRPGTAPRRPRRCSARRSLRPRVSRRVPGVTRSRPARSRQRGGVAKQRRAPLAPAPGACSRPGACRRRRRHQRADRVEAVGARTRAPRAARSA